MQITVNLEAVEALFLCLDLHLLFSDLELVYVCSTTCWIMGIHYFHI